MTEKIQKPWLFILTIGLGTLLNPLNSSMISVALTRMQHEFTLTFADASWLISIFYLASAAGQPVMGKLSDMFGPEKIIYSRINSRSCGFCAGAVFAEFPFTFSLSCTAGNWQFNIISQRDEHGQDAHYKRTR